MLHKIIFPILLTFLLSGPQVLGQEMDGGCPMCRGMGSGGMILPVILIFAFIAVLVSLSVFLIRRSRNQK